MGGLFQRASSLRGLTEKEKDGKKVVTVLQ